MARTRARTAWATAAVLACTLLAPATGMKFSGRRGRRGGRPRAGRRVGTDPETGDVKIVQQELEPRSPLIRLCGCDGDPSSSPKLDDIRDLSNEHLSGGDELSGDRFSNMIWVWGQFLDHDLVATLELDEDEGEDFEIKMKNPDNDKTATMKLKRAVTQTFQECRMPVTGITPHIDAGVVYGNDDEFLQTILRQPGSCKLRTSPGDQLPVTSMPDDEGKIFYVAGDMRAGEHSFLYAMHLVWVREHNRLCDVIRKRRGLKRLSVDEQFDLARQVVIAKMQQITVTEWLPLLGISVRDLYYTRPKTNVPDISVEFAGAAFRFGHDFVPERVERLFVKDAFNAEKFLNAQNRFDSGYSRVVNEQVDALIAIAARNRAAEPDGRIGDVIRNTLFGDFGEDLGSRNIFRGRDMQLAYYKTMCDCFGLKPVDKIEEEFNKDLFLALVKEKQEADAKPTPLGPLQREIVKEQFHRILFGEGGNWWRFQRQRGLRHFRWEILTTSLDKVFEANTGTRIFRSAFIAD